MNTWERFRNRVSEIIRPKAHVDEAAARDPKKVRIVRPYQPIRSGNGFEDSPIDLNEVSNAYHTDAYIKRAVDKYIDLMFKEGWDISGKDDAKSEYVWTRLKLMAEATNQPTDAFFYQAAFDYVLFGNAYIVKARQTGSKGNLSGVNATGYTSKQAVAGYFVLPANTVTIERDDTGNVTRYQQQTGGGSAIEFAPENVIHMAYKRPTGRAYGVPMIANVLDDVLLLRQIEENVVRLVHKHLFPVYLWKVGLAQPGYEATDEEIEQLEEELANMPIDGTMVVPERHDLKAIGAEGQSISAEGYLKYFRQRVFSGLGVSDSVMGIGDSANKSTSDNQSADLFDAVKEFQRSFANAVQHEIINELLFEGGYDPVINPDDEVHFYFREIQLDAKVKMENHATQLFMQNVITHEELRQMMGLDPVADESRLWMNMSGSNSGGYSTDSAAAAGENDDQPENQSGKKKSPGNAKREQSNTVNVSERDDDQNLDDIKNTGKVLTEDTVMVNLNSEIGIDKYFETMTTSWTNLKEDVLSMVKMNKSFKEIKAFGSELIRSNLQSANSRYIYQAMDLGLSHLSEEVNTQVNTQALDVNFAKKQIIRKSEKYVTRLIDDIVHMIEKSYQEEDINKRVTTIEASFDSNRYRLKLISKAELYRAYNYGRAIAAKEAGYETIYFDGKDGCPKCRERHGEKIDLSSHNLLDSIPPYHPGSERILSINIEGKE